MVCTGFVLKPGSKIASLDPERRMVDPLGRTYVGDGDLVDEGDGVLVTPEDRVRASLHQAIAIA